MKGSRRVGMRVGVRSKLLGPVILLIVAVLLLQLAGVYGNTERRVDQELHESNLYAGAVATGFTNYLESLWNTELALGTAIALDMENLQTEQVERLLTAQAADHPTVNVISWLSPEGVVLASTVPGRKGVSLADREYFQQVVAGQDKLVSDLTLGRISGTVSVAVARGIRLDGRLVGVVVAGIDLSKLDQVLPPAPDRQRRYGLVDRQGVVVYYSASPDLTWEQRQIPVDHPVRGALRGQVVHVRGAPALLATDERMGVAIPLPALGWAYFSSVSRAEVVAEARREARRDAVGVGLAAFACALVAWWLGGRFLHPILALQKAARAIAAGNLGARVRPVGSDEVADTARVFDSMAERVQRADEEQKARVSAVAYLGQKALGDGEIADLAAEAAVLITRNLGMEFTAIVELLPGGEGLRVLAGTGWENDPQGVVLDGGHWAVDLALRAQQPLIFDHVTGLPDVACAATLQSLGISGGIAVLIAGRDQPFGVLVALSRESRRYAESEVHFLQALANVLATASDRRRLQADQRFLAEAGMLLTSSLDYETTMASVASLSVQHLSDWCIVDIVEADGSIRRVAAAHADPDKVQPVLRARSGAAPESLEPYLGLPVLQSGVSRLFAEVPDELLQTVSRDSGHLAQLRGLNITSAMVVPLRARGGILGVIFFLSAESGRRYGPADLVVAEELARRAALAVENARLYREARVALASLSALAQRQATVAELGQRFMAGVPLTTLLADVLAAVTRHLDVPICEVLEQLPETDLLVMRAGVGDGPVGQVVQATTASGAPCQVGYTLATGEAVVTEDIRADDRFGPAPHLAGAGVVSGISVLIPGDGRPYGVLGAYARESRTFTTDDIHFLQTVAHALGTALERKRAERRMATQYAVTMILAQSPTVEEAGTQILQAVCQGLEWDMGVLWVARPEAGALRCAEIWQSPGVEAQAFVAITRQITPARGEGLPGQAWASGEPIWVPDVSSRAAYPRKQAVVDAGLHAGFWFPILVDKGVYGIVECFSREIWQPDAAMLRTAATIGAQIGQFIRRKRAEEAVLQLNAELEERVATRTAELAAANQELEAFAYSVSHDLRAPLRTIDGFGQALLEDCGEQISPEGQDHLRRIRAAAKRMGTLIDDLLRLSRVMRSEMNRQRVDMSRLARQVVAELRNACPEHPIAATVTDGLVATGDERLLRLVLENLLSNAWKFTGRAARPEVAFGSQVINQERVFYVRDNGAGFDMQYAGRLFKPFQRLHSAMEFEGTGVGLATVGRIIQRHGGRVWAEAAPNQGATFYFTLGEKREGRA